MEDERTNNVETPGTEGNLDQDLLDQLASEETFSEEEYLSEDKGKRESAEKGKVADAIWNRTKALNLPANNEIVADIYDNLCNMRVDRARVKLAKLEKSRAEQIDRLAEEKARQMQDGGLTRTDSAQPSGRSKSVQEATNQYAEGLITEEEAKAAGVKLG